MGYQYGEGCIAFRVLDVLGFVYLVLVVGLALLLSSLFMDSKVLDSHFPSSSRFYDFFMCVYWTLSTGVYIVRPPLLRPGKEDGLETL